MTHQILVVDDEQDIRELLQYNLQKEGLEVTCVGTGEQALAAARAEPPDLILLDLMLPGLSGLDCCRVLKGDGATRHIPIVMLTAKGEDSDVVTGLDLGADDYVTKPFSPRVLMARVNAVLRRRTDAMPDPADELSHQTLRILPARHEVLVQGAPVDLTATQFSILHFLCLHPGWVFSRNQIINAIKGEDYPVTERSVDVQIVGLRKKLGESGALIETVRGVGYRIKE